MNSYQLLRHLTVFWTVIDNPVFQRETRRPPLWHSFYVRLSQATGLVLMLGGLTCYLSTLLVFFLNNLLILLIPVLVFWTLIMSVTLAPVIVDERERQTWATLRTTPLDIQAILLGKASGALWWLRDFIRVMIGLLILFALGVGLVSLILIPGGDNQSDQLPGLVFCGVAIAMPVLAAGVFVADRAQYFTLMAVSVIATSASVKSGRVALSAASVVGLVLWLAEVGLVGVLLALQPGRATLTTEVDWLALVTLGPVVSYISEMDPLTAGITIAATLGVREIMIRGIWQWTLRRSQQLV